MSGYDKSTTVLVKVLQVYHREMSGWGKRLINGSNGSLGHQRGIGCAIPDRADLSVMVPKKMLKCKKMLLLYPIGMVKKVLMSEENY